MPTNAEAHRTTETSAAPSGSQVLRREVSEELAVTTAIFYLPHVRHRPGFTLIEILVVLILMGLVAALVAPTLLPRHHDQSALNALLVSAREAAARRGEVLYVHIDPTGEWRIEAGASPLQAPLATGHMQPVFTAAVTLMVSPLGTCGFDVRSAAAVGTVPFDPLSCEMRAP